MLVPGVDRRHHRRVSYSAYGAPQIRPASSTPTAGLPAASAMPRAAEIHPQPGEAARPGGHGNAVESRRSRSRPGPSRARSAALEPRRVRATIGIDSEAKNPPRSASRTAAEQAASAVSMARTRISSAPAPTGRTPPEISEVGARNSDRPDFDHVWNGVAQQVLDAVPQGRRRDGQPEHAPFMAR